MAKIGEKRAKIMIPTLTPDPSAANQTVGEIRQLAPSYK
jgi:hypothetical protein